jgi:SWI/SNF-related matrix-associated actin-dependent regulator 1 of chromatin subfamily A
MEQGNPQGFKCIVADEAHYLKSPASRRSLVFKSLQVTIEHVLFLTGTPAHRHADMFHLLHLLDPGTFAHFFDAESTRVSDSSSRWYFASRYCVPQVVRVSGRNYTYKFTQNQRAEELSLVCEAYVFRLKKDDVLELPPLERRRIVVGKADPVTREHFREGLREVEEIRERRGNRYGDVALLKLCKESALQKAPMVITHLETIEASDKVLIFYHHQEVGNLLAAGIEEHFDSGSYVRIDGKTNQRARQERIHRWQSEPSVRFGLCSLCATSTGLNLQFCHRVVYAELTFLSIHHVQSESRVHRMGQTCPVVLDYVILDGTTDSMVWGSIQRKRQTEGTLFDLSRYQRPGKRPRITCCPEIVAHSTVSSCPGVPGPGDP